MSTAFPQPFDARNIPPASVGGSQLPISDKDGHLVCITDGEVKPTKAGDGGLLELTLTIMEGEHAGASGSYRLNLWNQSDKARNIAQSQMSAICHVTNVFNVQDVRQLYNIPFRAIVALQKGTEQNNDNEAGYTEVKGVKYANGGDPGKPNAQPQQQQGNGGTGFSQQQQQQPTFVPNTNQNTNQNNGGFQQQQQPNNQNGGFQHGGFQQQPQQENKGTAPWKKNG